MKQNLLFCFLLCSLLADAQERFTAARLHYTTGASVQKNRFESIGVSVQYEHYLRPKSPVAYLVSAEMHAAGTETKRIDLSFGGRTGHTDVDYRSAMYKLMAGGLLVPLNGHFVSPYFSIQGGTAMYHTKMTINDPADDYCKPEDARNIKASLALIAAAESGIKVRVSNKKGRRLFAQAGISYTVGTKASYIKLGEDGGDENTRAYTSKFRMSNGEVHSHSIGTLYRTNTSQLGFQLGISFEFDQ